MKKGFVLVETIVVITILATSLLLVYNSFNSVLVNEHRRMYYDDPLYLYRTYYILDLFQSNQVVSYLERNLAENAEGNYPLLLEVSCYNSDLFPQSGKARSFCEKLMATDYMDVERIYFTYQDVSKLTACTNSSSGCEINSSLSGVSASAIDYLSSLGGDGMDGYRIVIEYTRMINNKKQYFYASLVVPIGEE